MAPASPTLICRTCGAEIHPKDEDRHLGLARCDRCGDTVELLGTRPRTDRPAARPTTEPNPDRTLASDPDGSTLAWSDMTAEKISGTHYLVRRAPGAVEIRWSWASVGGILGTLFVTIFWNGIVSVFWAGILSGKLPWFVVLILLPHTAAGLALIVTLLSMVVNRTVIRSSRQMVTVSRRPIPFPRPVALPTDEVKGLKRTRDGESNGSPRYRLAAETTDGRSITLLHWLTDREYVFLSGLVREGLGLAASSMSVEDGT